MDDGRSNPVRKVKDTEVLQELMDLSPRGIRQHLGLSRPIYARTAAYGHFGREDIDLPWERTDKAEALKTDAAA